MSDPKNERRPSEGPHESAIDNATEAALRSEAAKTSGPTCPVEEDTNMRATGEKPDLVGRASGMTGDRSGDTTVFKRASVAGLGREPKAADAVATIPRLAEAHGVPWAKFWLELHVGTTSPEAERALDLLVDAGQRPYPESRAEAQPNSFAGDPGKWPCACGRQQGKCPCFAHGCEVGARHAEPRPAEATPLYRAAEEAFDAFNTSNISLAQAAALAHLGTALEQRRPEAQPDESRILGRFERIAATLFDIETADDDRDIRKEVSVERLRIEAFLDAGRPRRERAKP